MKRTSVLLLIAAISVLIACNSKPQSASTSLPECHPGQGELCPSEAFYNDFQRWKALRAKITEMQKDSHVTALQETGDEFQGLTSRLNNQFPAGHTWDEKRSIFIPAPQLQQPVQQAPVQAPPQLPTKK